MVGVGGRPWGQGAPESPYLRPSLAVHCLEKPRNDGLSRICHASGRSFDQEAQNGRQMVRLRQARRRMRQKTGAHLSQTARLRSQTVRSVSQTVRLRSQTVRLRSQTGWSVSQSVRLASLTSWSVSQSGSRLSHSSAAGKTARGAKTRSTTWSEKGTLLECFAGATFGFAGGRSCTSPSSRPQWVCPPWHTHRAQSPLPPFRKSGSPQMGVAGSRLAKSRAWRATGPSITKMVRSPSSPWGKFLFVSCGSGRTRGRLLPCNVAWLHPIQTGRASPWISRRCPTMTTKSDRQRCLSP